MLGLTLSSYYFLVLGENGEAGVRVVKEDIEAAATTERYEQSTRRKKNTLRYLLIDLIWTEITGGICVRERYLQIC